MNLSSHNSLNLLKEDQSMIIFYIIYIKFQTLRITFPHVLLLFCLLIKKLFLAAALWQGLLHTTSYSQQSHVTQKIAQKYCIRNKTFLFVVRSLRYYGYLTNTWYVCQVTFFQLIRTTFIFWPPMLLIEFNSISNMGCH